MEQMCRLRPKAPLQPYIVPYKGDIDLELLFIPPQFSNENDNRQIREGSIKIRVISAQNLIPANHNIRNETNILFVCLFVDQLLIFSPKPRWSSTKALYQTAFISI